MNIKDNESYPLFSALVLVIECHVLRDHVVHLVGDRGLHSLLEALFENQNGGNEPNCHYQHCQEDDGGGAGSGTGVSSVGVHQVLALMRRFVQTVAYHLEDIVGDEFTLVVDVVDGDVRVEEDVPSTGLLDPMVEDQILCSLNSFIFFDSYLLINLLDIIPQFNQNLLGTFLVRFLHRAILIELIHVLPPFILILLESEIGSQRGFNNLTPCHHAFRRWDIAVFVAGGVHDTVALLAVSAVIHDFEEEITVHVGFQDIVVLFEISHQDIAVPVIQITRGVLASSHNLSPTTSDFAVSNLIFRISQSILSLTSFFKVSPEEFEMKMDGISTWNPNPSFAITILPDSELLVSTMIAKAPPDF